MMEALRLEEGNPGLELGLQLGEGWQSGRDKICIDSHPSGFGLWAEQLLAESTGKQGKGLVPAPGESPDGPDRQRGEVRLPDPYELGAGVAPVGVRDRGRGSRARDQPVRPARRPGGEGQDERGSRRRRARRRASRLARRAARPGERGGLRLHPGVHRPGPRRRAGSARSPGPTRPAASSRAASARATCTRRASCTRAGRTPVSSSRSSTTQERSWRSRAATSASAA